MKWSLIAKYIFKEADEKEKEAVRNWMSSDPENRKLVNDLDKINFQKEEEMEKERQNIDVDQAWNKFKSRITETSETRETPVISLQQRIMRYAAVFIMVIGLSTAGYFVFNNIVRPDYISMETKKYEMRDDIYLPDGSLIALNKNSEVHYPKKLDKQERYVEVKGEVFFDVKRDPSQPFVIKAEDAVIKVLGTSFNVRTDLPGNAVEVFVKSGKVKFFRNDEESRAVMLEPGYIGILMDNNIIKRRNDDINYLAWKTGKMLFKETSLEDVVSTLNSAYNVEVKINDPEIKDLTLSASFNNESIQNILQVISKTFNIKVVKKGKYQYVITKNS